ncbi:MAG: helix-turn-helix domain-containing protein [bacterium]
MNKPRFAKFRADDSLDISAWVLRRLKAVPDLDVTVDDRSGRCIRIRAAGGSAVSFEVLEERLVSEERARLLVSTVGTSKRRMLIATLRLAAAARSVLRDSHISWIERETGRCRLYGPGLLVEVDVELDSDVDGNARAMAANGPPALLRDKSGLLAEALLIRPHDKPISLTDIASTAGLSRALASRLLARLTTLGILAAHGRAPRKHWTLRDAGALLDRWADEERIEPEETTGINVWSRTPEEFLDQLSRAGVVDFEYALGGVAAANFYAPTLTVTPTADVWIPASVPAMQLASQLDGQVVASGANVRVLQTSGDAPLRLNQSTPSTSLRRSGLRVISVYRAYVEALHSPGRGPDAAKALRHTLRLGVATQPVESHG